MRKKIEDTMKKEKRKKKAFIGFTHKSIFNTIWTVANELNLITVIQKTKPEAMARYDIGKHIIKVRITIEEI